MGGDALRELLTALWPRRRSAWVRFALRRVGNTYDAEDIVQDALLRTLQANPDIRSQDQAERYIGVAIFRGTANLARARAARDRALRALRAVEEAEGESALSRLLRVEEHRELMRLYRLAKEAAYDLPSHLRQVFELLVLREPPLKMREVADIQGIAVSTVHLRLTRALESLRQALENVREEGP